MFTKCFNVYSFSKSQNTILLIARILLAAIFITSGLNKMQDPFGWNGPSSPFPPLLQFAAVIVELCSGVGLLLGLITPLACLGLIVFMGTAVWYLHFIIGFGFFGRSGYQGQVVTIMLLLVIFVLGPGSFSLDRLLFGTKKR